MAFDKFKDLFGGDEQEKEEVTGEEEDFIQLDLDGNQNGNLIWIVIAIVSGIAILAIGGVVAFTIIKKKKRGAKENEKKNQA